jgi:predicted GNAT superfamily acetyltransferase
MRTNRLPSLVIAAASGERSQIVAVFSSIPLMGPLIDTERLNHRARHLAVTRRAGQNDALMFVKGSDYSVIRFLWSQGK